MDYLKTFSWDLRKYNSSRTMVEIAGTISDQMKKIDADIKKQQDEINELRNQHAGLAKLDGNNFTTQDISKAIYTADNYNPSEIFVEAKGGSEIFQTLIAIVHETKIDQFINTYENVIPWEAGSTNFTVVPRSAR